MLMLITRAPLSTAQMTALAMSESQPLPSAHSAVTGRISAPGAAPATPTPLPVDAARIPATCVPWPSGSVVPPGP